MTSTTPDLDPARAEAVVSLTSGSFADYPLSSGLLDALAERGLTSPTPIQAAAIPALLSGRDVVGQARTGSGKTLAFSLPLLDAVDSSRTTVQALVLAPTRELASQVAAVIADFGATRGVSVALLYGGTSSGPQRTALRRGAQVAVGTPGRILDLIGQGALWLDQARFVVLDEADEMFDQGFAEDVERIMDRTSNSRQTALFSATMPDWVQQTAARYLYDPETIAVDAGEVAVNPVPHVAYVIPTGDQSRPGGRSGIGGTRSDADMRAKLGALRDLLDHRGDGKTIVFGRTRQGVASLARQLDRAGYPVGALQGNMTQAERDFVMDAFRSNRISILVATNVAARGLDLADVNLVINVELPESAEMLTHRVGRTGRMGGAGQAITLLAGADLVRWQLLTRDASFPIRQLPWQGAAAALALGDEQQSRQLAALRGPSGPTPDPTPATDDAPADDHPVEEGPIMDEPRSPERTAGNRAAEPDPAERGRTGRPVRRPSRRSADIDAPDRVQRVDDAADLIARALASVGATSPSGRTEPAPSVPTPGQQARPERETSAATWTAQPERIGAGGPEPIAEPIAGAMASPPRRGTPRPPWLRDAAERVARWQIGGPLLAPIPATAEPPVPASPTDQVMEHPVTAVPERPVAQAISRHRDQPVVDQPSVDQPMTEQPVAEPRAATLPPVRRRSSPGPVAEPAARPVAPPASTAPEPEAPATVASASTSPDPAVRQVVAPRPIPTVRGSRSRPATPAPALTSVESGLSTPPPAEPVVPEAAAPAEASATSPVASPAAVPPDAPDGVSETSGQPESLDTAKVPSDVTVAQPLDAPGVSADEPAPSVVTPPVRRRGRARPAAEPATVAEVPQAATDEAAIAEPTASTPTPSEELTEAAGVPDTTADIAAIPAMAEPTEPASSTEPAPKPARRRASRRAPADTTERADTAGATDTTEAASPSATTTSTDATGPAASVEATPEAGDPTEAAATRSSSRARSGRSRKTAAPAEPEPTADQREASDADDDQTPAGEDEAAPKARSSRSRSRSTQPETGDAGESPAPKRQRSTRQRREPDAPTPDAPEPDDEPAPGNRRASGPRPTGGAAERNAGDRSAGGSQRGRPAERGNGRGPERGNSALAQPARRAPVGAPGGGPPFRRRPTAAPTTRCAACGTPLPKGSTRKYCPACERELALRSQES